MLKAEYRRKWSSYPNCHDHNQFAIGSWNPEHRHKKFRNLQEA